MTLAAVAIVFTTPLLYCGVRYSIRSKLGALTALAAAVAWVRLLLAIML